MTETTQHNTESLGDAVGVLKRYCKNSLIAAGVFSGIANLLMLVPAFYMLNVYDKAIGSNSMSTLLMLSLITLVMFVGLAAMEALRSRMLVALGTKIDRVFGPLIYRATFDNALKVGAEHASARPLADFGNLRQFIAGTGAITVFDAPWIPIYLLVMFLFHPVLGWMGVISAGVMLAVAGLSQRMTTAALQKGNALSQRNMATTGREVANAEVAASMGMFAAIEERWQAAQSEVVAIQEEASIQSGVSSAIIKTLRLTVQSVAIGLGALLVLQQEISPGMLIAGSILVGRALQPIEMAVGAWARFVDAKGQYERLRSLLEQYDQSHEKMSLPDLLGSVEVENVSITPPGTTFPTIKDSTFHIAPGDICMIVGPSGAGKSSLIRGLLGLWPTSAGSIRLDGAEVAQYNRSEIGPQIGYLPQDIELFGGSIAANIARLSDVDADDVIAAAKDAGIHDFILSLPQGYDTEIGRETGLVLSPGQQQRLALARALYRRPRLVILDEPNSNLDQVGEAALNTCIKMLKELGSTVIMVSHRQGALELADQLVLVSSGRVTDSGKPEEVLARLAHQSGATAAKPGGPTEPKKIKKPLVKTIPV